GHRSRHHQAGRPFHHGLRLGMPRVLAPGDKGQRAALGPWHRLPRRERELEHDDPAGQQLGKRRLSADTSPRFVTAWFALLVAALLAFAVAHSFGGLVAAAHADDNGGSGGHDGGSGGGGGGGGSSGGGGGSGGG